MLIALWSPKGGSGTSVVAAALAVTLAQAGRCRLVDLAGDQAALFGVPPDPGGGLAAWLAAGPVAPSEALEASGTDLGAGLTLFSAGPAPAPAFAPEAGAALAIALRDSAATVVDAGLGREGTAADGVLEVADLSVMVVRGCYLGLRRALGDRRARRADGVVLVDEPGRVLGAPEVAGLLERPVLARVPVRASIARAVDAGVLACGLPSPLARAAEELADGLALPAGRAA